MKKQKLLFLFIFYCYRSFAISDSTSQTITYKSIDVQSDRLLLPFEENNRNILVIDKKTIESLPASSLSEILAYCNGIDIRQRGPNGVQSDVSINGGTFDQTLMLINGVKIIDPQTGHHLLNLPIPLSCIERIEILKGASARRYGINAINGAINIITKKNIDNNTLLLEVSGGSNFKKDTSTNELYNSYSLGLTTNFKINKSNNILSVSKHSGNGYRHNTAYDNHKILFQTNTQLSHSDQLNILTGYINNKFGANSFYAAPADKDAFEKVETFIGIAEYSRVINKLIISPKLSYRYNYDDYIFIRQKPEVYENNHYSHSTNFELNNSYQFNNSIFALGLEFRNEKLKSNNLGDRNRNNVGVNVEHRINFFGNKLNVISGIYINHNNIYGTKALPGIDIGYQINNSLNVYANWGAGQRIPTYTDLYYDGPANIGNDQLRPEESYTQEIGFKLSRKIVKSNLTLFNRKINHFIDWTKVNSADAWQASNFNSISTNGLSLDNNFVLSTSDKKWAINSIRLSYTRLNSTIEVDSAIQYSRYTIENLRDQLILQLNFNLAKNTTFSISHRYQNRVNYKDYNLVDFRFGYKWNKLLFKLDGVNIFDEKFEEVAAVPMAGRWWDLGISYQIW